MRHQKISSPASVIQSVEQLGMAAGREGVSLSGILLGVDYN